MGGGTQTAGALFNYMQRSAAIAESFDTKFSTCFSRSISGLGGMPFGGTPFGDVFFGMGAPIPSFQNFPVPQDPSPIKHAQDPPIIKQLPCTLEDLYEGFVLEYSYSRRVISPCGTVLLSLPTSLKVNVKPGMMSGQTIVFKGMWDWNMGGNLPADIQFVVKELPHPRFKRKGNDLTCTYQLTVEEARRGTTVEIKTLDNHILCHFLEGPVLPNHREVIRDEGMPISTSQGSFGNLIVEFEVNSPHPHRPFQHLGQTF